MANKYIIFSMTQMTRFTRGFTLIELLVVIAIVGVMSAVILSSLNTSRGKGADANVKANLAGMRSQADLYYTSNGDTYGSWNGGVKATCPVAVATGMFSDSTIIRAIASALSAGGNGTSCIVTGGSYAIAAGMKTANQAWCIDSGGISKLKTGVGTPDLAITGSACN